MSPGSILFLRGEMTIKEDLPLIKTDKTPDSPLSIRPIFLCIEVSVADGKGIKDFFQDSIKETGVHNVGRYHKSLVSQLPPWVYIDNHFVLGVKNQKI